MRRLLTALLVAASLVLAGTAPALAEDLPAQVTASVQVTAYINVTILDQSPLGLNFGSRNPGAVGATVTDSPYDTQSPIVLTVKKETNVPVNLQVKGTDFSNGTSTIPIGSASWHTASDSASATPITDSFATMANVAVNSTTDQAVKVYHWLDIPTGQMAGNYSATFYYQATSS